MPYDKGDFTQQGVDGKVAGGLLLNNKRDVDVIVSTNEDDSTLGAVAVTIEDHLNDLKYTFGGENLEAGEVYEIGAGGDSIPIRYIKCNIVNNSTYDLYAGNTNLNPDFTTYAIDGNNGDYPYTMEGVNALVNSDIDTPVKIADANGGTGVIYYIPSYFWKTNEPSYLILRVDGDSSNITNKTNITWYEDNGRNCIKLTDNSQNGEFTWTITTAFFPD